MSSSLAVGGIVFAAVFGAALLGTGIRAWLPGHHLSADSRSVVSLGMGLIGTMAALVLSLLISSAKSSYDTRVAEVTKMSADVILLDRVLAHYGPETKAARDALHLAVAQTLDRIWAADRSLATTLAPPSGGLELLYDRIQALSPGTPAQQALQTRALAISLDLAHARLMLMVQIGSSIPTPFLVVLVSWLAIILVSFGLFAPPRNATVIAALFVCALAFSSAIFLILELDQPFQGLVRISSATLRSALAQLGQ
jgi:hypothetical protein